MGSSGYHSNTWHRNPPTSAGQDMVAESGCRLNMLAGSSLVASGSFRHAAVTTDYMIGTGSSENSISKNSGLIVLGSSNDERITITKRPQAGSRLTVVMTAIGMSSALAKKTMAVLAGGGDDVRINTSGRQVLSSTNKNFKSIGRSMELVGASSKQWYLIDSWSSTGAQFWTISTSTA